MASPVFCTLHTYSFKNSVIAGQSPGVMGKGLHELVELCQVGPKEEKWAMERSHSTSTERSSRMGLLLCLGPSSSYMKRHSQWKNGVGRGCHGRRHISRRRRHHSSRHEHGRRCWEMGRQKVGQKTFQCGAPLLDLKTTSIRSASRHLCLKQQHMGSCLPPSRGEQLSPSPKRTEAAKSSTRSPEPLLDLTKD